MGGKRNKIRYQSTPKKEVRITLSGEVLLQYRDDIEQAKKGDLGLHPRCDALNTTRAGEYEGTGFSGYFKVDVYDGRQWCAVLLNDIFPENEHHFAKSERPIDTYYLCDGILRGLAGRELRRTYREHYEPVDEDE